MSRKNITWMVGRETEQANLGKATLFTKVKALQQIQPRLPFIWERSPTKTRTSPSHLGVVSPTHAFPHSRQHLEI